MGRSVLAVLAGYAVVVVLTMAAFVLMFPDAMRVAMQGGEPPKPGAGAVLMLLAVGALTGVVGGAVAALVGRRGARNGRALGALMAVLGALSMAVNWGKEPLWFQVGLIAIAIPTAMAGGALVGPRPVRPTGPTGPS